MLVKYNGLYTLELDNGHFPAVITEGNDDLKSRGHEEIYVRYFNKRKYYVHSARDFSLHIVDKVDMSQRLTTYTEAMVNHLRFENCGGCLSFSLKSRPDHIYLDYFHDALINSTLMGDIPNFEFTTGTIENCVRIACGIEAARAMVAQIPNFKLLTFEQKLTLLALIKCDALIDAFERVCRRYKHNQQSYALHARVDEFFHRELDITVDEFLNMERKDRLDRIVPKGKLV